MGGNMGRCPDWYIYVRAARYGGYPVFPAETVFDLPEWWMTRLLTAEAAELEAEGMARDLAGGGTKRA